VVGRGLKKVELSKQLNNQRSFGMVHFQIYQARDGYRWRLWAVNNRIVAESGEAYVTYQSASNAVKWVKEQAPMAPVR
jgi:uncharacterized protein YegP (UPF0339 family)